MNIAEKSLLLKKDLDDVYEAGKKAEYDAFWDAYQQKGTRVGYYFAFSGKGWNDETFQPKYDIISKNSSISTFQYCEVTDLVKSLNKSGVIFDTSEAINMDAMFAYAITKTVPALNLTKTTVPVNNLFLDCKKLETIEKLIVSEGVSASTSVFRNCESLKDIIIEGNIGKSFNFQWSPLLTHESLMSIINALKDYSADTSGTVHTITLGADNLAKLSADEIDIIERKGWNYG